MTDEQEYVYAIAHPHNYVKLGRSNNPQDRLQRLQTGSPYELWMLACLPVSDGDRVESDLHDHLSQQRERGEWFTFDYDDYDMIVELMKMAASDKRFESLDDFHNWQQRKREAMK